MFSEMGPPPIVNGISPREGPPGTKITIRGENFGISPQDLVRLYHYRITLTRFFQTLRLESSSMAATVC